ncbi:DNA-binding protein [Fictibacillus fluitans]|uniref:DNA-binding protein n=1 Tax=Fictibacillus fluitans TaxID=3058422 RepID=A0ABT8I031_9BACL|nr:DNA-binding protein [Fictibacillus sp. NE201]MDN4525887.1 DNA-binding protein [Fictibacillus sp. NE201]
MRKLAAEDQFPPKIGKPAQRALAGAGITSYQELANESEKTVSMLHGMGPNALGKLKAALQEKGLSFKKE